MASILNIIAAFSDSGGISQKALVDAQRHAQVDIVSNVQVHGVVAEGDNFGTNKPIVVGGVQTNDDVRHWTMDADGRGDVNANIQQGNVDVGLSNPLVITGNKQDDTAWSTGNDFGFPIFGHFDDAASNTLDENDVGVIRCSTNRNLYTTLRDAAGNERGANVTAANELNVIATAQPGVDIGDVTINGPLGQAAMAASIPVVIASDQSAVPISAASLPLPSGAATEATLSALNGKVTTVDTDNVTIVSSVLPTGAATSANQTTEITALQLIDDIVHERNVAFSKSAAIGGELDDTATVAATEGNVSPVRITAQRALHTNLRNAAGTEIGTETNPVRINPTGTTNQPVTVSGTVTVDSELPAAVTLADNTANPTVPGVGSFGMIFDGSTWDRQPGNSAGGTYVQGSAAEGLSPTGNPVVIAGHNLATGNVQSPDIFSAFGLQLTTIIQVGANAGLYNIDTVTGGGYCAGDIEHDATDSATRPVAIGAVAAEYEPTATGERGRAEVSAAGDRVKWGANRRGEVVVCAKPQRENLTALNNVFDTASETVTSATFDVWMYANGMGSLAGLIEKSGSPTRIDFTIEVSNDGTNFQPYLNHGLGDLTETNASIGTGGKPFHITFPLNCYKIRFKAVSTGTNGSNTITLSLMTAFFGK